MEVFWTARQKLDEVVETFTITAALPLAGWLPWALPGLSRQQVAAAVEKALQAFPLTTKTA
jgi:hypothetical protein